MKMQTSMNSAESSRIEDRSVDAQFGVFTIQFKHQMLQKNKKVAQFKARLKQRLEFQKSTATTRFGVKNGWTIRHFAP